MKNARIQVGLDISKKHLDLCALDPNGQVLLPHRRYANSHKGSDEMLHCLSELMEAGGFTGLDIGGESTGYYWMPLFLQIQTDENWQARNSVSYLLNSRQVHWFKKAFAEDDKSDDKDSYYVAERVRTQRRKHPWQSDLDWLRLRFYSRLRFHIGQNLTREKNYFWAHMFLQCNSYGASKPFSDAFGACGRHLVQEYADWHTLLELPLEKLVDQLVEWSWGKLPDPVENANVLRQVIAESYRIPPELSAGLHHLLSITSQHIQFLDQQAAQVEAWMQKEIDAYHPEVNHLSGIKGLGVVLAAGIASEIGDLQRFFQGAKWDPHKKRYRKKNLRDVEDAVSRSAGLWWPRRESGDFQGEERRLSKKGNRFLRYYLFEGADKLRQFLPEYQSFYQRKYKEATKFAHKRALVLTARKSVGLFVGLLHRNEPYRPQEVTSAR